MNRLDPPRDWDLTYPELDPIPYWQLISETGHDDYAFTEDELTELRLTYGALGAPFTIERHFRLPN
jgi:hypothetical protein